jgi:hypothetical protein
MENEIELTDEEAKETWERFQNIARGVLTTPKEDVERGLAEEKKQRGTARIAKINRGKDV